MRRPSSARSRQRRCRRSGSLVDLELRRSLEMILPCFRSAQAKNAASRVQAKVARTAVSCVIDNAPLWGSSYHATLRATRVDDTCR
jgi:hypothetical protein